MHGSAAELKPAPSFRTICGRLGQARLGAPASRQATDGNGCFAGVVARTIAHLERNYMERVTLRDLEAVTARTPYQIIRAFRRHLGTTPHAFLMRLRVRCATALLLEGESIVAAAAATGFADQSHFTRHFKRLHGITPGAFLRRRTAHEAYASPCSSQVPAQLKELRD